MDLFLDTADIKELEEGYSSTVIRGVTTNPSLIKKASQQYKVSLDSYLKKMLKIANNTSFSLEVTGTDSESMIKEGLALYRKYRPYNKSVCIKIPISTESVAKKPFEGLKAINALASKKIPVNCTLIFTPEQALLAANAGASFVSPFVGRIDDLLRTRAGVAYEKSDYFPVEGIRVGRTLLQTDGIVSGVDLIWKTYHLFSMHGVKAKILAASIRNQRQLHQVAIAGADIATIPFAVFKQAADHEKTDEGLIQFVRDSIPEYKALSKLRR